jgi:4-diphosphocytidyl-2-C-methyl-D-erythritol kinase
MGNDFELVADSGFPEIPEIRKELMAHGADGAMLAGSGSAVFGVFTDSDTCNSAYEALKLQYARCFRARTILHEELRTHGFISE